MIAIDTNVFVYGEGIGADTKRRKIALSVIAKAADEGLILPAQVLAETFRVLVRKGGLAPKMARARIADYEGAGTVAPTMSETLALALDLSVTHKIQIFDAIILTAAAETDCRMLISEDMQDGFVWRSVTVVNPFLPTLHPLLQDLLGGPLLAS